jgi:hypothetical protein
MSQNQDFKISKLIELARTNKYEMSCAGFAALDKIDKLPINQKYKTRKNAVQALIALSDGLIKFDYFSLEERKKLQIESGMSDAPFRSGGRNLFTAPKVQEDLEEDYIPQEEENEYHVNEDGEVYASKPSKKSQDEEDDDFEDEDDFEDDED